MTDLVTKQLIFTSRVIKLLVAFPNVTFGEAWRSPETCALYAKEGKGIANSCHTMRLAIDLNLWVNGALSNTKADYAPLGLFWKAMSTRDALNCWGGDFTSLSDFYHFSIEHNSVR